MRFSIIINNYNYGRFVGQAIESALAVEWLHKETIVVDDGSTDDSRAVIEAFGDRIIAIFTENGGQAKAVSAGFARSTGDVVIFLDADDLLLPSVVREVMAAWRPGLAKVQYGMIYVDQQLQPLGRHWPVYTGRHTPEAIARLMRQTGDYRWSPTSGNAWSREYLKEVLPLPACDEALRITDVYLSKLAPFFGDVVSLKSPQCLYRRHVGNHSSGTSFSRYLERYPWLMRQAETVQRLADEFLQRKQRAHSIRCDNEYHAKLALVLKRFFPRRYPGRLVTLLLRYWRTAWRGEFSPRRKLLLFAWGLVVATAPRPIAGWVVEIRDNHDAALTNPKGLTRILAQLMASR